MKSKVKGVVTVLVGVFCALAIGSMVAGWAGDAKTETENAEPAAAIVQEA